MSGRRAKERAVKPWAHLPKASGWIPARPDGAHPKAAPKRNKHNAVRAVCKAGHKHDSKREAARCDELHLLERGGVISGLQVHPVYKFAINGVPVLGRNGRQIRYTGDFTYIEDGQKVVEDIKSPSTMTEAFGVRAAFFRALWPQIRLEITQ